MDELLQKLREEWIKSELTMECDFGERRIILRPMYDGVQIGIEGSPLRGQFIVQWPTCGYMQVWFRYYDGPDFLKICDLKPTEGKYINVCSAIYRVVKTIESNLKFEGN